MVDFVCKKKKKNTLDFSYRITQKSVKILKIITKTLDFDKKISPDPEKFPNARAYRLTFTRRDQALCFLALMHGNSRFSARQQQYTKWAALFLDQHLCMLTVRLSAKLKKIGHSPVGLQSQTLYYLTKSRCTTKDKRWYQGLLKVTQAYSPITESPQIDLTGAWFSGFIEAEGTFRSYFYPREKVKRGYSVSLAIEFRQNNAYREFQL